MPKRTVVVVALLVLVAGCQAPPPEFSDAQRAEIENAVKAAVLAQASDWEAQEDMDRYISHHSDWAFGAWPGVRSLDGLRALQTANWERFDYETSGRDDMEIRVLAPNVAVARFTFGSSRTDADGTVRTATVHQAQVWVLEEAGWKLLLAKESATRTDEGS